MTIEQRKAKWLRFYDLASSERTMVLVDWRMPGGPFPTPTAFKEREAWAYDAYLWERDNAEWLDDDRIPCARPYTGTEIFAEAYGSPIHYPSDNMPFALPRIRSAAELRDLREPDVQTSTLGRILDLAHSLKNRLGGDVLLQMPDIQSPVDIAALIWEKADFLMSMVDNPEAILEIVAMTERTLTAFLDTWFASFGREFIAHYPDYYMQGGMTLSEDEIGEISSDMFLEFCLEPLRRLSARYGGMGLHCCAHARHQWEELKKIEGLRLINLVQPPKTTREAYHTFAGHCAQMHAWCGEGLPTSAWLDHIPKGAHVVLHARASSRQEAADALKALQELSALRAAQ